MHPFHLATAGHANRKGLVVRHLQGEPMEKMLAWAESEVGGFFRN